MICLLGQHAGHGRMTTAPPSKVHHILTIGGAKTHQKAKIAANTVNLVYWIGVRMDGSLAVVSLLVLACD